MDELGDPDEVNVRDVTLVADSRAEVFHRLAELVRADSDAVVAALERRETDGGTAVSPEIAIPHATIGGLDRGVLIDVTLDGGVRWDREHAHIRRCFCVLVPDDALADHAPLLAEAARRAITGERAAARSRASRCSPPLHGFAAASRVTGIGG